MSSISTLSPASTYPDLFQIANSGQALNNTPSQIQDGLGNPTSMTISTNYINFDRSVSQFQIDSIPLTADINTLNAISDTANAKYVLLSPNSQLANGSVLTAAPGISITQNAGQVLIAPSSELAGIQQLFSGPTGMVVNLGGGIYDTRDLISDATINIVNGSGVGGNPTFNVIPDTSVQRTNVQLHGIFQSRKSQMNFIPGGGIGINILDNPSQNRTDIIFSGTPGSAFTFKGVAYAKSTANLNAIYDNGASGVGATLTNNGVNAALTLDSVLPPEDSLVLINDQNNMTENGVYFVTNAGDGVTPWVLTRPSFYDSPSSIIPGTFFGVINGAIYGGTGWVETLTVDSVGSDNILFVQFGVSGSVTSVNGTPGEIVVTNNNTTPIVSIDPTYLGQTSITTLGVVTNGTWNADPIDVDFGGTGLTPTTPYGVITGGITPTGPLQNVGTGNEGEVLTAHGAGALPTWESAGSDTFRIRVNQVAHGLLPGDAIRCSGDNTYARAFAFSVDDSECIGIVVSVSDDDNFVYQFGGVIDFSGGLVPPNVYFLSEEVPGEIKDTPPIVANQVVKPLIVALTPITGLWIASRGQKLGPPTI